MTVRMFSVIMEDMNGNDNKKQESRCFVCDAEVHGRYYALATCRTQNSGSRVIEKLGELVGERYMVVISEDDVICRSCGNLINSLDRLETEMHNVRGHVLRFLEQKYSLEEGELLGSTHKPKPCQPPQITKGDGKEITSYNASWDRNNSKAYSKDKRSHSWLQCDKCKYTTHLNSFMMYHVRDHMRQKILCDKCGQCISENQKGRGHSCRTNKSENKENQKDNSAIVTNDIRKIETLQQTAQQILMTQNTSPPLVDSSNCKYIRDHSCVSNILSADENKKFALADIMQMIEMDNSSERMTEILKS